jgi:hypothetical protein
MVCNCEKVEVFRTQHGCVYQCNTRNCFFVEFAGHSTPFTPHSFVNLKNKIDSIDLNNMLTQTNNSFDLEVISPLFSERCFVLGVSDVINFRELLSGAKVMLELNGIIFERLYSIHV